MKDSTLSILNDNYMLATLLYLKNNRPAIKTELYNNVSRSYSMNKKLDRLQEIGLLTTYSSKDGCEIFVVLTDKGEKVARYIEDLIDTVERDD